MSAHLAAAMKFAGVMLVVMTFGTLGFWLIEDGWSVWKSLYFTLITITTVGYGDEGISDEGEKFAALLLVCGLGTFTYSLSNLMQIAADYQAIRRKNMQHKIDRLRDHIIVCGYGRVGRCVIKDLTDGGLATVIIEQSTEACELAAADGYLSVKGVASDDETLLKAGVKRARGIVCAVDSDAENLFIAVSTRDLNDDCFIASRAESDSAARKLRAAGVSLVVSPYEMAGENIASTLLRPNLSRMMKRANVDDFMFDLGEVCVGPDSEIAGQSIQEFGKVASGVVFLAIVHSDGESVLRPRGDGQFEEGDYIIFAARPEDKKMMERAARGGRTLAKF